MITFLIILAIFILGYVAIALEHPLKVDKSATALLIGALTWTVFALDATHILNLGFSTTWNEMVEIGKQISTHILPQMEATRFSELGWVDKLELGTSPMAFVHYELSHHLIEIAEILFFLFGAMTIVEIVDQHDGFKVITEKITTTNKVKLLWIIGFISFFLSAALDNLTTTIVMIALLRKLIDDKKTRWMFASIVVLAANAGGAWSPIGDVTTIMLWIGGQVTAKAIIVRVFLPSVVNILLPLGVLTFMMKGQIERPKINTTDKNQTSQGEQILMFSLGVGALLFVPVFKTVTHLPPYLGMMFGLGMMWLVTEIIHRKKSDDNKLAVVKILKKVETPTIFFFLGILLAVAALQTAGHLALMAGWLDQVTGQNVLAIASSIGILSAIVDNVPLVAGAMGMYPIAMAEATGYAANFVVDGQFWELLAYCAGTGGSILIIGSAAGVAAMGLEKIDFIWYLKKISWLALIGYIGGILVFMLEKALL